MPRANLTTHRFAKGMVDELVLFCVHRSAGCSWTGRLDARCSHEASCSTHKARALEAAVAARDIEVINLKEALARANGELGKVTTRAEILEATISTREAEALELRKKMNICDTEFGELWTKIKAKDARIRDLECMKVPPSAFTPARDNQALRVAGLHPAACADLRSITKLSTLLASSTLPSARDASKNSELSMDMLSPLAWAELKAISGSLEGLWSSTYHVKWPVYIFTSSGCNGRIGFDERPDLTGDCISRKINAELRTCNYFSLRHYLKMLHNQLTKNPLDCCNTSSTFFRCISISAQSFEMLSHHFPLGSEVAFPDVASASYNIDIAKRYGPWDSDDGITAHPIHSAASRWVMFVIHQPEQVKAEIYQVNNLTIWPEEQGVLIMPLVRMRVKSLRWNDSVRATIGLTVVGRSCLFEGNAL